MVNPEHLALLKQGVEVWNEWRDANEVNDPDLSGADLRGMKLGGAHLSGAHLSEANLNGADLSKANFSGANLNGADLYRADLSKANFTFTNLREANLSGADLIMADLRGADLSGAGLQGADLREADLRRANLSGVSLREANLSGANLREANLSGADLIMADLREADLIMANLSGANLSWVNLEGADLSGADLHEAGLSWAHLRGANLREADLSGADLIMADLSKTNFNGADLSRAKLSRVSLLETIFSNTNLAEVEGLDTCRHDGPSVLDFRMLQKSGPLPLAFLRGCGLPDLLIDYLPSLLNQPIQFYSCFISYSSKDEDFAQRLYADLQNKDVRCWFAPKDIQGGRKLHEQIGEAIRIHEKLLLVLSENSMNSEWVKTEIAKARQREVREKRQVLFPVRLVDFKTIQNWECFDADTGKDSAREIREYFIPDFSSWKSHDVYQQAFKCLLRDLKLELGRKLGE